MTPAQIEAYVDAAAAALALPLAAAHRPGVLRYFAIAADMAALVDAWPLTPHDDPAEAFVPIGPPADGGAAPVGPAAGDSAASADPVDRACP